MFAVCQIPETILRKTETFKTGVKSLSLYAGMAKTSTNFPEEPHFPTVRLLFFKKKIDNIPPPETLLDDVINVCPSGAPDDSGTHAAAPRIENPRLI